MHAEAAVYMRNDHADNPDFPDHFTYIPYDKEKVNRKLDYIVDRLFKEKYLDCECSASSGRDDRPALFRSPKGAKRVNPCREILHSGGLRRRVI